MIPQGVEIFVAVEPVDMRLGFERLGALVLRIPLNSGSHSAPTRAPVPEHLGAIGA